MKKVQERTGSIYVLHNLRSEKEYAGQTIKLPEVRWAEHIYAAFIKMDRRPLYCAMRKNVRETGKLNFTGEVVWRGSESKLNAAEKRTVRQRKTFIDWGWGYNLTTGGDHFKLSKRSIRKIRKTLIQYYKDCPERCLEIGVQSSRRMADPVMIRNLSKSALRQWADSVARQAMSKKKLAQYRKDPTIRAKVSAAAKL